MPLVPRVNTRKKTVDGEMQLIPQKLRRKQKRE